LTKRSVFIDKFQRSLTIPEVPGVDFEATDLNSVDIFDLQKKKDYRVPVSWV
jgi:hypothetical protein